LELMSNGGLNNFYEKEMTVDKNCLNDDNDE
jgi:hypothetical protein